MIVIGTDTHKRTHTCGGGRRAHRGRARRADRPSAQRSVRQVAAWARALDPERVWAIEDCRHVSGAFERFLIARGELVVRVAPKHMAGARRSSRERGKSDSIDAFSVARAALKEGIENSPQRTSTARRLTSACSSTIARISSCSRTRINSGCAGTCTTSGPSSRSPHGALDTANG